MRGLVQTYSWRRRGRGGYERCGCGHGSGL